MIADGAGALMAVFEAVTGNIRDGGYDLGGTRTRRQALVSDVRQAVRDLPGTFRTAVKAAKLAQEKRADFRRARSAHAGPVDTAPVIVPSAAVFVDTDMWGCQGCRTGR